GIESSANVARSPAGDPVEVVIEVRDNGVGIPVAARHRLFERFFRAHEREMPTIEGTGLGPNLVRDTVESLGGRVWCERPEDGTTFAFTVPCRRPRDAAVF